jgi:hypothetical protein
MFAASCSNKKDDLKQKYNRLKLQSQELELKARRIYDSLSNRPGYNQYALALDSTAHNRFEKEMINLVQPLDDSMKILKRQLDSLEKLIK